MTKYLIPMLLLALSACSSQTLCPSDEVLCGGSCVSVQSDTRNCGACGKVCSTGEGCFAGACQSCASSGACQAEVVAACFDTNEVREFNASLEELGAPIDTSGSGPIGFAYYGGSLFVADSIGGSVDRLAKGEAASIASITGSGGFSDLEQVGVYGNFLYISNAAAGTLVAVDPVKGGVAGEVSLAAGGPQNNPLGFDFANEKAYVAVTPTYGAVPYTPSAVAVVDLSISPPWATAPSVKLIDLSSYAAAGAVPGPANVLASSNGARVFVTLNDLYASDLTTPVAGAHGLLVVIDTATDAVVGGAVDLGASCLDASGMALLGNTLYVGCGYVDFSTGEAVGGAILPVDVSGSVPVPGAAISVAHVIGSLAFCGGQGYAGGLDAGALVQFNPSTSSVVSTNPTACPASSTGYAAVFNVACAQ